ncbi:hypothetical protein FN976_06205 [Caenimonas sedimenti]|uniref:Uncharacterized protein n=1 Tax=Caenimonas sedimenti TaxID=2596921 RepID=A0A562ZVT4_9BURK|nr:hypothetical protein [Caenimonas sedimenti]TWO72294.1 hypothetical protein FN976_06205 [Caenimonas sedimenti]
MKAKFASIALAGAYLAGQGSMFLFQMASKATGHSELAGIAVLAATILSFGFQFSELGAGRIISYYGNREFDRLSSFVVCRIMIAVVAALLFATMTSQSSNELQGLHYLGFAIAVLASANLVSIVEARQSYVAVAIASALPWLATTLGMMLYATIGDMPLWSVGVLPLVVVFSSLFWSHITSNFKLINRLPTPRALSETAAIVLPLLYGQVWGRLVVIFFLATLGWESLANFGIVRYLQVAIVLISGFILRPLVRGLLVGEIDSNRQLRLGEFLRTTRNPFIFSIISTLIAAIVLWIIGSGLEDWTILLFVAPLQTIASIAIQISHAKGQAIQIFKMEQVALMVNAIVFCLLWNTNPALAMAIGEMLQMGILIAYRILMDHRGSN